MLLMSTAWVSSSEQAIGPAITDRPWIARLADWLAESRSHRVICLIFGICLLNGFDLALTLLANQQGVLDEQNPLARQILRSGPLSMILYKIGMVLVGSYPILRFRSARITELGALVVLIAYATLAVHWSAVYELYSLTQTSDFSAAEIDQIAGVGILSP